MTADRNKTDLTHKVTDAVWTWLDNHGFKPIETEVPMPWTDVNETGWIADLAAVICPTQTELIEMKMIPRAPQWRYQGDNSQYEAKRAAWEAVYKPLDRLMTCLVEVKTSRSDYCGDRKWNKTPSTDMAFVAVPSGMVKQEEWPEGWGVLELRGEEIVKVRNPTPRVATAEQHLDIIYQIAIRRDHRTRYKEHREEQKQARADNVVKESMDRIDKIISAITDIASGKTCWGGPIGSIEEALRYHGIRNAREPQLERLAEIFGIAAKRIEQKVSNSDHTSNVQNDTLIL